MKGILRYNYMMSSDLPATVRSASVSDIGRVRNENQDSILADDALGLWLVADGMGGHAGGARASAIARDTVRDQVADGASLPDAVMAAHHAIRAEQRDHPDLSDMGTTIVALAEHGRDYEVCWVGDSRAYRYSADERTLHRLTHDHNVAGVLVASGALTPDQATRHPQRHVLTDCLGLASEDEPRVDTFSNQWQEGDVLLLCSDGLSGEVEDAGIEKVFQGEGGLQSTVEQLLAVAMESGAHDNISMVAVMAPSRAQPGRSRWRWPFLKRSDQSNGGKNRDER